MSYFTKQEERGLGLCLANCNKCPLTQNCNLRRKLEEYEEIEPDAASQLIYDLSCKYYGKLYGLVKEGGS